MYLVVKYDTYLADFSDWSQTWVSEPVKARLFTSESVALAMADQLEATVVACRSVN